jgi:lysophospholipase L1-like esterase
LIRINQYGHHDDDFPLTKRGQEFRGVVLGDSITMGHGVTSNETFSNQLERLLRSRHPDRTYQIINTGVQGYSTFQEYNVLLRSLVFQPDFIAVGFCMNDPVEPYVIDKRFGGVGADYHGVAQVPSLFTSYVVNETGYGRLLQALQTRHRSVQLEQRWQTYSVEKLAKSAIDDPAFAEHWKATLGYLDKIYATAATRGIKVVLMIFPFTFQFMDEGLQAPERILTAHARSRNVAVIDFTRVFEQLIYEPNEVPVLRKDGFSSDEIAALYRKRLRAYYLDDDHYTAAGHEVIAARLYDHLVNERVDVD